MATTYLGPQQLQDFAQRVEAVAKKFPEEVVRIRYSFSRDWDGDPAIYFRVVLTDKARQEYLLSQLTGLIGGALVKDLALYEEYSGYIPYFYYRAKSEEDKLQDPEWE
jgi:hypothetical protein